MTLPDRPLSPITERSSFSTHRSPPPSPRPTPQREISYESEQEDNTFNIRDDASIYSQESSVETITPARTFFQPQPHDISQATPEKVTPRPLPSPFPSATPTPLHTPRESRSGTSTPTSKSGYFNSTPPPSGLLPPPRPALPKRESSYSGTDTSEPSIITTTNTIHRRLRQAQIDAYPGGREVINLDAETDDEDEDGYDAMSIATATTAGIAGVGAGERRGPEESQGKADVQRVQAALRGIVEAEEQEPPRRRKGTESVPSLPRSRPNSFFYDQHHPTLHNIPTFPAPIETASTPSPSPIRLRSPSKLFKSPPTSRLSSRPGSIKGGVAAATPPDIPRQRPSSYHAGMQMNGSNGDMSSASGLQESTVVGIPTSTPSGMKDPVTIAFSAVENAQPAQSDTTDRSRKPSTARKRASRIIPDVVISLFSESSISERKREAAATDDGYSDMKVKGEVTRPRTRSRLTKSKSKRNSSSPIQAISTAPDGIDISGLTRKEGSFGVQDDGSERIPSSPDTIIAPPPPIGLGLELRRWSSGAHTVNTTGTAKSHTLDRGLFVKDAMSSSDAVEELPAISERSDTGHSQIKQDLFRDKDGMARFEQGDSPVTPEIRTPDVRDMEGVSAVTPPIPIPEQYRTPRPPIPVPKQYRTSQGGTTSRAGPADSEERHIAQSDPHVLEDAGRGTKEDFEHPGVILTHAGNLASDTDELGINPNGKNIPSQPRNPRFIPAELTDTTLDVQTPPEPITKSTFNGLPPLPPSFPAELAQAPTSNLPLLIASHLLSTHAAALLQHSANAAELSTEMHRLAQESLEWSKVLMSMAPSDTASSSAEPSQTPLSSLETPTVRNPLEPYTFASKTSEAKSDVEPYDGLPNVKQQYPYAEDAYTRLLPRIERRVPSSGEKTQSKPVMSRSSTSSITTPPPSQPFRRHPSASSIVSQTKPPGSIARKPVPRSPTTPVLNQPNHSYQSTSHSSGVNHLGSGFLNRSRSVQATPNASSGPTAQTGTKLSRRPSQKGTSDVHVQRSVTTQANHKDMAPLGDEGSDGRVQRSTTESRKSRWWKRGN